jgi:hypothetical protein
VCVAPSLTAPTRLRGEARGQRVNLCDHTRLTLRSQVVGLHGVPAHDKMSDEYMIGGRIGYNA